MSGLFTRLAQQHIGQRRHSIAVARQSTFPQDIYQGSDAMAVEPNGISNTAVAPNSVSTAPVAVKTTDVNSNQNINTGENGSSSQVVNANRNLLTPNSFAQSSNIDSNIDRNTEVFAEPDVVPPATTEQSESRSYSQSTGTANEAATDSQISSLEQNVHYTQVKTIEPAPRSRHKFQNVDSRQRFEKSDISHQVEQDTVINVTIGRIEVKAVTEDKAKTPRTKSRAKRKPLVSLDDYQAQRQRGER